MDYSPYQRRSYRQRVQDGGISLRLFMVSAIVGFLLFWGIKSLFFGEDATLAQVTYSQNNSRAEIKIKEGMSWENLGSGFFLSEGDEVRTKKGNTGVLHIGQSVDFDLGLGSRMKIGKIFQSEKKIVFGDIFLEEGPILLDIKSSFGEKVLKIWFSNDVYLLASTGKVFFQDKGVAVIDGENFVFKKIDDDGKIRYQKTIGIGQYINLDDFSLGKGIPEKLKKHPLVKDFFEFDKEIEEKTSSENGDSKVSSEDVQTPKITVPASSGEIVEIKKSPQYIEGIAPEGAEKIWVYFSDEKGNTDEYLLKNFSKGDKKWKYIASPQYDNLSVGKNTYKIYSENKDGEKSLPAVIILQYLPEYSEQQIFSNSKGKLIITYPANGNDTVQSNQIIKLKGVAPSNASYITVVNKTLGTEYTLKKFKKGDSVWNYSTGKMDNRTYRYLVKAQDSRKRTLSYDTISVTVRHIDTSLKFDTDSQKNLEKEKKEEIKEDTSSSTSIGSATSEVSR